MERPRRRTMPVYATDLLGSMRGLWAWLRSLITRRTDAR